MQALQASIPAGNHHMYNINDMTEHMLRHAQNNAYTLKYVYNVDDILVGNHSDVFSDTFIEVLWCTQVKEKFCFAKGRLDKEFHFQYLLQCFYGENDKLFPSNDLWHQTQGMGFDAFHSMKALSHKKVAVEGDVVKSIFCPHCGYHSNNPTTLNMHILKHNKAGLYCLMPRCNTIANSVDAMSKHGSLAHGFRKVSSGTLLKVK